MARSSGAGPLEIAVCRQSEGIEWAREYLGHTMYVLWLLAHTQANLPSHRIGSAVFSVLFCSNFMH